MKDVLEEERNEAEIEKEEEKLEQLNAKLILVIEEEERLTEDEEQIIENLGKFIKYNKQLLYLNLSHTQIGTNLLKRIVICLRRAMSLLVLDISGNIGITDQLREYLSGRIRCRQNPLDVERLNYVQEVINMINKSYDNQEIKKEKILKSMQMRSIKQVANLTQIDKLNQIRTFQPNENLIYQRVLGHKLDMPGSGQWRETSAQTTPADQIGDWITDKNIYTLIFWSKNFDRKVQKRAQYKLQEILKLARFLKDPDMAQVKERMENMPNKLPPYPVYRDG